MGELVDFLIIGAEKSGTTWLAAMLRQHPGVFIPEEKELFYFNRRFFESPEHENYNFDQPLDWYLKFFKDAGPGQLKGEASPAYLWDEAAPGRIKDLAPRAKLVALLRDPVERAFSQYLYFVQRGYFDGITFEQALEKRPDLRSRGLYAAQLARYRAIFPQDQLLVLFYDDLRTDGPAFLAGVQAFLGLPPHIPADIDERRNVTGRPRYPFVNRLIAALRYPLRKYNPPLLMRFLRASGLARLQERLRLANTKPFEEVPALDPWTEKQLRETFRPDIRELENMTGRNLEKWIDE